VHAHHPSAVGFDKNVPFCLDVCHLILLEHIDLSDEESNTLSYKLLASIVHVNVTQHYHKNNPATHTHPCTHSDVLQRRTTAVKSVVPFEGSS
jgi:hypothetical protein